MRSCRPFYPDGGTPAAGPVESRPMPDKPFLDRFSRLEIPEARRNLDWRFLDTPLRLPRPVPLEAHPVVAVLDGRALVPTEGPPGDGEPSLILYDLVRGLQPLDAPDTLEESWLDEHRSTLEDRARRWRNTVPTDILREPVLRDEARTALERTLDGATSPLLGHLLGEGRLLRLQDALYDLRTLHEYAAIFERAIEPRLFRTLQALPPTAPPEAWLAEIEANLDGIHGKARSPLRNKMSTSRLVVDGVTLLPIYLEGFDGLLERYVELLDARLRLDALAGA